MKRILSILLIVLLLTGCTDLSPDIHMSVTPHEEREDAAGSDNPVFAEDYLGLRTAIMDMIGVGSEEGRIRVITYDGNVESDLSEIVYGITRQDPLGAYAVDYMSYTCERIVSYYDIALRIYYRRSPLQIMSVKKASGTIQLQQLVEKAVTECKTSLVVRVNSYWEQDVAAMAARYCAENPEQVPEMPEVAVTVYPETGASRILEIEFRWSQEPKILLERKKALTDSLDGAADYIRYRKTDEDKIRLLFTYLVGRFHYEPGQSVSPLYAAVCEGVADPWGLSTALQLICERSGIQSMIVEGRYGEQDRTWNLLLLDGTWVHVDLYRCLTEDTGLQLCRDDGMTGYSWDAAAYPASPAAEAPNAIP